MDDEGITAILNNKYTAGLAAYVDKRGEMSEEGIERLVEVMGKFRDTVDLLPDCETLPFATASLRNISNRESVIERVREATGFDIRVLSGYEEAMLDYRGAVRSLPGEEGLLVDGRPGRNSQERTSGLAEPLQPLCLRHNTHRGRTGRAQGRGQERPCKRPARLAGLFCPAHVRRGRHGAQRIGALPRHGRRTAPRGL